MKKIIALSLFTFCLALPLNANIITDYLAKIEQEFDTLKNKKAKFELITKKVNFCYLRHNLQNIHDLDEHLLTAEYNYPHTYRYRFKAAAHPAQQATHEYPYVTNFHIAIESGDVYLVQKFLSVIDDVNIPELTSQGYRQPYAVAHQILDPVCNFGLDNVHVMRRLTIIDMLAEKGADFNAACEGGAYDNPPLACGDGHGRAIPHNERDQVRALALLYGASPQTIGTYYNPTGLLNYEHNRKILLKAYLLRKKAGIEMHPQDIVMKAIKTQAEAEGIALDTILAEEQDFNFTDRFVLLGTCEDQLNKLAAKLDRLLEKKENNEKEILRLSAFNTKKQKAKGRHLEDIRDEHLKEEKKLIKKINDLKALKARLT